MHAVTRYEPKMDKVMRLHSVTSTIENGFVYLPEKAAWLGEFLHEMTSFPKGRFDDQCDSVSQALDWVKSGFCSNGFMKWLENETSKAKSKVSAGGAFDQCPSCQSTEVSNIGPQKRCLECGNQWGRSKQDFHWPTKKVFTSR